MVGIPSFEARASGQRNPFVDRPGPACGPQGSSLKTLNPRRVGAGPDGQGRKALTNPKRFRRNAAVAVQKVSREPSITWCDRIGTRGPIREFSRGVRHEVIRCAAIAFFSLRSSDSTRPSLASSREGLKKNPGFYSVFFEVFGLIVVREVELSDRAEGQTGPSGQVSPQGSKRETLTACFQVV